ncbi:MAG: hypothetical protein V2A70_08155, partial [Candidatus Omnitrophota bacterium]
VRAISAEEKYYLSDIKEIRFLVTKSGSEPFAGVSEIMIKHDLMWNGVFVDDSIAFSPDTRVYHFGKPLSLESQNQSKDLFLDLVHIVGINGIKGMQQELITHDQDQMAFKYKQENRSFVGQDDGRVSPEGNILIRRNPVRNVLQEAGVSFYATTDLSEVKSSGLKVYTVNNVVVHQSKADRLAFFSMLAGAMNEGDVIVMKNISSMVAADVEQLVFQLDVYQKASTGIVYMGTILSDVDTKRFIDEDFFVQYAQSMSGQNVFSFAGAGKLVSMLDASQKTGEDYLGGIDIKNIDVKKSGDSRIMFNDQVIRNAVKDGFDGFIPFIHNITPVSDLSRLLGVNV